MDGPKHSLCFVTSKGNEIWLASLGLAWQQFEYQAKFQLQSPQNARYANSVIESLRAVKCSERDLDDSIYYAAGIKSELVPALNKELQTKFANFKTTKLGKKGDQILFYGAIYKELKLKYPFYKVEGKIMHFRKVKVPCFEPVQQNQRNQVFILKYTNQDNFFVRIDLFEKGNQMFILMANKKFNLEDVFEMVRTSDDDAEPMTNDDIFKIPQIKIQASHVITDLSGLKMKNKKLESKHQILPLEEHISLFMRGEPQKDKLDDLTLMVSDFEIPRLKQRRMCLKDPFWIVLRNKGCVPYFAMFLNKPTDAG